jgi:hypothetical protein
MYVLAGLLALGFICNLLIRPLPSKYFMTRKELEALDSPAETAAAREAGKGAAQAETMSAGLVYAAWIPIAVPLLWSVWVTLQKAALIFSHG